MKKMLTASLIDDIIFKVERCADVSELADETDSKSVVLAGVWVRVPPSALKNPRRYVDFFVISEEMQKDLPDGFAKSAAANNMLLRTDFLPLGFSLPLLYLPDIHLSLHLVPNDLNSAFRRQFRRRYSWFHLSSLRMKNEDGVKILHIVPG